MIRFLFTLAPFSAGIASALVVAGVLLLRR